MARIKIKINIDNGIAEVSVKLRKCSLDQMKLARNVLARKIEELELEQVKAAIAEFEEELNAPGE